ncbi:MAG: GIY-YIG nuclease family protein [Sedimentisphaerales bacterium]|nr:GIY-YIG nuclease family protein [Sedimentisphaerales bacterium]
MEEICLPNDIYGWAPSGIYSFWNYYTKEIYYIGLAVDLGERFKQHNNILPITDNGCKYKQINNYFSKNQKLGYSIFVQSLLSQVQTHRNQTSLHFDENNEWISFESKENIKIIEGSFIGAFKKEPVNFRNGIK